jgi:HAD superfamily hydrolase (TIGR01509 family)
MRMAGLGEPLSENLFYSLGGVPTRRVAELMGAHYGLALDADRVFHEKEKIFTQSLSGLRLIEPVVAFARAVSRTHPVAVASGGPRDVVGKVLAAAGLAAFFPIVVTADDVDHGKPAPDSFLLAARLMGVAPVNCLVFEDAEPGFRAAEAAGMKCVRVPSRGMPAQGPQVSEADRTGSPS